MEKLSGEQLFDKYCEEEGIRLFDWQKNIAISWIRTLRGERMIHGLGVRSGKRFITRIIKDFMEIHRQDI